VESHAAREPHVHVTPADTNRATSASPPRSLLLLSVPVRLLMAAMAAALVWAVVLWALR
jgi:hypothetical protein